jgi:RAB protein geranylgeranyltransferase component A
MGNFIKFEFTEQDILDSFDYFMKNGEHKKKRYYLEEIVDEFLDYAEADMLEAYGKENLYKCKKYIRNRLYGNDEYLYNMYGEDENK